MKYFCIGLFKTGTMSYSLVMNKLGIVDLHFPQGYVSQLGCEGVKPWLVRPWDSMSNVHEVEYPECDELYPDSKFILTTRNVNKWLLSIKQHMGVKWPNNLKLAFDDRFQKVFGVPCDKEAFDEEMFSKKFIQHEEAVKDYFAGSELLLVQDLDSEVDLFWNLADFVRSGISYPHENRRRKVGESFLLQVN